MTGREQEREGADQRVQGCCSAGAGHRWRAHDPETPQSLGPSSGAARQLGPASLSPAKSSPASLAAEPGLHAASPAHILYSRDAALGGHL